MEIPPGYRFRPNDQEITLFYLINKVINNPFPDGFKNTIRDDCDDVVYGDFMKLTKIFQETRMDCLYFYVRLKKKTLKRVERVNQYGTWRSQKDTKIFSDPPYNTNHVGSKRSFMFVPKEGVHGLGRWVMYEFRLDGIYRNTTNNDNIVICQIKHKKGIKEEQQLPQMGEDVHFNTMGLAQHSTTEKTTLVTENSWISSHLY
ncbi:NAC domain containing protein 50-like [Fagus crenata]